MCILGQLLNHLGDESGVGEGEDWPKQKECFLYYYFLCTTKKQLFLFQLIGSKMRDVLAKIGMQLMLLLLRNIYIYFVIFIKNKIIFLI
jgi:hypothetical protein